MNYIVEMRGIVKRFPGLVANNGVNFDLRPGEIHALLGENGAGKTTLMNILYGLYTPDAGEVYLRGRRVNFASARDAIGHGLGMVHQHFKLVNRMTVAENITLGQPSPRAPLLENRRQVSQRLLALSERYGLEIHPDSEIWQLSVGEQQRVEILKALYRGAEVIILDEPTAVLTPQEATDLIRILRQMAAEGKSIIFISHKLDEVLAASDRITVLRDGRVVETVLAAEVDKSMLARMMVGRNVLLKVTKKPATPGQPRLQLVDVWAKSDRGLPALRGLNLTVRSGEIVGLAGVDGNGQSELEQVIAGLRPVSQGQVLINGRNTTHGPVLAIHAAGLAHIPSDRYDMGLLSDFSVAENLLLQRIGQPPFTRRGFLNWRVIRQEAARLIAAYDVRVPTSEHKAGVLSGGNAQKMILARELNRQPQVLLAAQPTRGVDVSAIEYIHTRLIEQRDAGVAILLISTELEEILTLSDRIAVLYEGQIVGMVETAEVDINQLGLMMAGTRQEQTA